MIAEAPGTRVTEHAEPVNGRCAACRAWVLRVPVGTPWAFGRCVNRSVNGVPGRRCELYGREQRFTWPPARP